MRYHKVKVAETIRNRLRDMPGLEIVLDTHSKIRHGTRFTQLLIDKPLEAYKLLVEVLGGSENSAIMILQYLLQPLVEDPSMVEEALKKLAEGDDAMIREIISSST